VAEPERVRVALSFTLVVGVASLVASASYGGARSAVGPYLAHFGASATVVGIVAGTADLLGYGVRRLTDRLARDAGADWTLTIIGCSLTFTAVPLLAVVGSWHAAALLFVIERLGTAVRGPARWRLLRSAGHEVRDPGTFMVPVKLMVLAVTDRFGSIVGAMMVAAALWWKAGDVEAYRWAFLVLAVPAALTLAALLIAWPRYPYSRTMEPRAPARSQGTRSGPFAIYMAATALAGFGLADWALLAFHVERRDLVGDALVPVLYGGALALHGVATLLSTSTRAYRAEGAGLRVLAGTLLGAAASLPLILLGGGAAAIAGIALWAIALGASEWIGVWTVYAVSPGGRFRAAFAIYHAVRAGSFCVGAIAIGALSDWSREAAAIFGAVSLALASLLMLAADHVVRPRTA